MTSPKTLISYDENTQKFKCHVDVLMDMSLSIKAKREGYSKLPVAIVSIVGDCRTGKSFLLNFLLRHLKRGEHQNVPYNLDEPLEGFAWKHGMDCVTKGIVVWPEPIIVENSYGRRIAVILMDTQGLNDGEISGEVNKQLFGLSMLLSSIQIYNLKNQIQSNHIVDLAEFSAFGSSVYTKTKNRWHASSKLVFLIRDWKNTGEYEFGLEGGKQFLNYKRSNQQNKFSQYWKLLDDCYCYQQCFLMPSPGEICLSPEYQGEIRRLKPLFLSYVEEFINALLYFTRIETKSWIGDELSLWEYTNFFEKVASHLEEYQCIKIDKLLDSFEEAQTTEALTSAAELYVTLAYAELKERKDIDNTTIDQVFEKCRKQAHDHFNEKVRLFGLSRTQKYIDLMEFCETFNKEYKAGNKGKKWWKFALKVSVNLVFAIGWHVLFSRFRLAGMSFRLLRALFTRT